MPAWFHTGQAGRRKRRDNASSSMPVEPALSHPVCPPGVPRQEPLSALAPFEVVLEGLDAPTFLAIDSSDLLLRL